MDNSFVEEVAASLVREFLSRKGLKKTISAMERELPRSALSINNRSELRNVLHLHSLYKQNKVINKDIKQDGPQYRPLGDTTRDRTPAGLDSINHYPLGTAL